jgi:hypothetical protein
MADTVRWSTVAMCMTPSAQTAKDGKYVTTGGVVKFAVGKSGSLVFFTALTSSLPAGRYVLRATLERDDPTEPNREPSLLGTNVQLRQRPLGTGGISDLLVIGGGQSLPVLGGNGRYVVDSPGRSLSSGIDLSKSFYWVQLELAQAEPATAVTRNAVIGLRLIGG